ncbi:MAG: hypothetical protein ACO29V_10390 [Limnohabitans sp.]
MNDLATAVPDWVDAYWRQAYPHMPLNKQTRENLIACSTFVIGIYAGACAEGEADAAD